MYSQGHESSGDLLIKNIQANHAGRYRCTAQTIVDNATAEADVFVKGWSPVCQLCDLFVLFLMTSR